MLTAASYEISGCGVMTSGYLRHRPSCWLDTDIVLAEAGGVQVKETRRETRWSYTPSRVQGMLWRKLFANVRI